QELGPGCERACDLQPFAVGERQGRCDLRALAEKVESLEHGVGVLARIAEIGSMQHRAHNHIVLDGKPGEGPDQLEGAPDSAAADLLGPKPLDARTIERDAAAIGRDCPCDDAEQRALPCPVWTDDRKNRALRYAKADVVHGKQAAEALADTL